MIKEIEDGLGRSNPRSCGQDVLGKTSHLIPNSSHLGPRGNRHQNIRQLMFPLNAVESEMYD